MQASPSIPRPGRAAVFFPVRVEHRLQLQQCGFLSRHGPHPQFLERHLERAAADGSLRCQTPGSCAHHRARDDAAGPG